VELLIHVVDAQLLVVIRKKWLKVFKTENVEQTNGLGLFTEPRIVDFCRFDGKIHTLDKPVEKVVVDLFSKGIAIVLTLF